MTICVSHCRGPHLEPSIHAVRSPATMFNGVGCSSGDRIPVRFYHSRKVIWMNSIGHPPTLQFLGSLAEVFQERFVELFNLTGRIHGTDEPGNTVDCLAEIGFTRP